MKKFIVMIALVIAFAVPAVAQICEPVCTVTQYKEWGTGDSRLAKSTSECTWQVLPGNQGPCQEEDDTIILYSSWNVLDDGSIANYYCTTEAPWHEHFGCGYKIAENSNAPWRTFAEAEAYWNARVEEIPTDAPGSITKTWAKVKVLYRD